MVFTDDVLCSSNDHFLFKFVPKYFIICTVMVIAPSPSIIDNSYK